MEKQLNELLKKTEEAYQKSDIAKSNPEWKYSISATEIKEGKILLVGFNWGAEVDKNGKNVKYNAQTIENIKTNKSFKNVYSELASFKKIYNKLLAVFPEEKDLDECIQSNFCFFRSRKEDEISFSDLQKTTPIFEEFLTIVKPRIIIGFSSKLRDYFIENKLAHLKSKKIPSNKRTLIVAKGEYNGRPIYFLPHPNAKIKREAREEAWKFCFEK